jgi:hypothetical protein
VIGPTAASVRREPAGRSDVLGVRFALQTWMDEDGIPDVLKTERMGHEMFGMHGVYGHVSPVVRADLKAALQERWEASSNDRPRPARTSRMTEIMQATLPLPEKRSGATARYPSPASQSAWLRRSWLIPIAS